MPTPSLEIINERTNKNTESVDKLFRLVFGKNGDTQNSINGKIACLQKELEVMKANYKNQMKVSYLILAALVPMIVGMLYQIFAA